MTVQNKSLIVESCHSIVGQHLIVVMFKMLKQSWATAGKNQNSIVGLLDLFLSQFCLIFSFWIIVHRDVSAGLTTVTHTFSDTLTLFQPGGQQILPLHQWGCTKEFPVVTSLCFNVQHLKCRVGVGWCVVKIKIYCGVCWDFFKCKLLILVFFLSRPLLTNKSLPGRVFWYAHHCKLSLYNCNPIFEVHFFVFKDFFFRKFFS